MAAKSYSNAAKGSMGHLYYGVTADTWGGCGAEHFSNLSPTLRAVPPSFNREDYLVLKDAAGDAPASAANTLSFTVDLGACLRRKGVDPRGRSMVFTLRAGTDSRDNAGQHMTLPMP